MNIANLPAVHYPFVLGIPRQMPCAPSTVQHQDALTDSQDLSMMAFSSFCKLLLREAMQDAGHLISTVAAICGCLAWTVLSSTCWYLRCRQNHKHDCGATEWDSQERRHHTIDVATRDPVSRLRVQSAKVLVVTTGTAFKAVDHWHPEIAAHIGASCILVHERRATST